MAKDFFPTAEFSKLMSPQAQSALRKIQDLQVIQDNVAVLQGQQAGDTLAINAINDKLTIVDSEIQQLNTDAAQAVTITGTPASGNLTEFSGSNTITNGDLSGDVTTSGTLAVTIANKAVTYAKMQDATAEAVICRASSSNGVLGEVPLAASQLLGRGSTGDVAAITLGTGLSMSGATMSASGSSGAVTVISTQSLAGVSTVAFTSISGSYKDLQLVIRGASTTAATNVGVTVIFNSDTTANYDWSFIQTNAATSSLAGDTGINIVVVPGTTAPANGESYGVLDVYDYANTNFAKVVKVQATVKTANAGASMFSRFGSAWWRSTTAITRIDVTLASGNGATGSSVTLYGISS